MKLSCYHHHIKILEENASRLAKNKEKRFFFSNFTENTKKENALVGILFLFWYTHTQHVEGDW